MGASFTAGIVTAPSATTSPGLPPGLASAVLGPHRPGTAGAPSLFCDQRLSVDLEPEEGDRQEGGRDGG